MNQIATVTHARINDLRVKKQNAIDVLDFETAESLENEIQDELDKFAKLQISDVLKAAKHEVDMKNEEFTTRLESEAEESRQNSQKLFTKYQVIVEEIEQQHVDQLMEIENNRAFTLIEESERDVEEQLEILEKAKKEAILSNFAKAKELRQHAREVAEAELERRRQETEEKFKLIKEETLEKQKEELDDLAKRHENDVNEEKKNQDDIYHKTLDEIQETFTFLARTAIAQFRAVSSNKENIEKASEDITNYTNDLIHKFKTQPRIVAELSNAEKMRLTTMKPTAFLDKSLDAVIPSVAPSAMGTRSLTQTRGGKSRCASVGLLSRRPMSKAGYTK